MKRFPLRATVLLACAVLLGACGKKDEAPAADTNNISMPDMPAGLQVMDIDMGKKIDAEKKISEKTDDFAPTDTIFASVHTTGAAANATMLARWTFQDGAVVDSASQTIAPTGDAYTEFHIAKASGFPKGKYTIHVMIDGKEVRTKDITVK
jgi:hypothetical protein